MILIIRVLRKNKRYPIRNEAKTGTLNTSISDEVAKPRSPDIDL